MNNMTRRDLFFSVVKLQIAFLAARSLSEPACFEQVRSTKELKIYLTEYYPFMPNLTPEQRAMEGGVYDRADHPLHSLDDYLDGKAEYVSLACDFTGGAPGNNHAFKTYGCHVTIPKVDHAANRHIPFRLVDTGELFYGSKKNIRLSGYEPIDICRGAPKQHGLSFDGPATLLVD